MTDPSNPIPKKRWQVLPPEGQGECDYNPEYEPAHAGMKPAQLRANAASHQAKEAVRLAKEYALLRPNTRREEISPTRLKEAKSVAAAWERLVQELRKRQRRF